MKLYGFTLFATVASEAVIKRQSSGDGPYGPVCYAIDDTLSNHTIYTPGTAPDKPMPVLIWGNGAFSADGTSAANFLSPVASYGFLAIAAGTPCASGTSTVDWMTEAISWVTAGANGLNIDSSKIMTAGYSCGGTEAYALESNPAVPAIGISNSGLLGDYEQASSLTKPVMYALRGPSDIAYENGERDYAVLPATLPAWKGNLDSGGHGGTYGEPNGGIFAKACTN